MDKYLKFIISSSKLVIFGLLVVLAISSNGINNFKLDASSDALVIEGDASLKKFREAEKDFGGSDFLIVVIEPHDEIFSNTTIETIKSFELEIENIKGIESVLSLVDAPVFFQPKVPLVEVSDNLKDLDDPSVDLALAKDEFLDNPIYRDLIISADGKTTAMQVNLLSNDLYDTYIEERYDLLDKKDTAGLDELNKKISDLNDEISQSNALIIEEIREVLNEYSHMGSLYLGGPSMIATDMMTFIKDDLVVFGLGVAFVFAIMLYLFFGNIWFVLLPLINSFFATYITAAFLGAMDWKISVVSSNFIALLLILTISLTVHVLVKFNELKEEFNDRTDRLKNAIRQIIVPCFFAAFTTGIAFISLLVGELKPVIEFGKMMSVGILIAFICTFTFIPAALSLIKNTNTKDVLKLHRVTSVLYKYTVKNTKLIFLISFISIFAFIYGAFKLEVENKFIDYFDDTTEIYQGMLK
ncbi:MAG: MMPL family transporter, partial [SAR86 cluster bacterium]|nr:MMPL family transporter [SAR86 cluster bacterium]